MANLGLATDIGNPNFQGAVNPDSVLFVKFFDAPMDMGFKSQQEGRPVKEMRTMVHIETPGNTLSIIETLADEHHKQRFPVQWQHYLNTKDGSESHQGTMLSDWPILNAAQVQELKYYKFYTVEQIAGASDAQVQSIGLCVGMGGHAIRDKAKLYLKRAADTALVSKQDDMIRQQAEMLKKNEEMLAAMQAQLDALSKPKIDKPANAKEAGAR